MKLGKLLRVFVWATMTGFLVDVVRRCWVVEAWSIFPIAAALLLAALLCLRRAWRIARRNRNTAFIRSRLPVSSFPEPPKRPIR